MVEPERVLHSVMVIAFERKGAIDEDLKIIRAIQNDLNLGEDEKSDALEHIRKLEVTVVGLEKEMLLFL